MVKRILASLLKVIVIGVSITSCMMIPLTEKELNTAITRAKEEQTNFIIIDDEVTALSGNLNLISAQSVMILDNLNAQRAAAGLSALTQTNELVAAATIRAQEQEQLFSHTRPNGSEFWTVDSTCCYGDTHCQLYRTHE